MALERCPCCGRLVKTARTDTIPIQPVEFRGYMIVSVKVQTRRCSCGCEGRTPVLTGKTEWQLEIAQSCDGVQEHMKA